MLKALYFANLVMLVALIYEGHLDYRTQWQLDHWREQYGYNHVHLVVTNNSVYRIKPDGQKLLEQPVGKLP